MIVAFLDLHPGELLYSGYARCASRFMPPFYPRFAFSNFTWICAAQMVQGFICVLVLWPASFLRLNICSIALSVPRKTKRALERCTGIDSIRYQVSSSVISIMCGSSRVMYGYTTEKLGTSL